MIKMVGKMIQVEIVRTHSVWRLSGFTKLGVTPGGGGRPPTIWVAFERK